MYMMKICTWSKLSHLGLFLHTNDNFVEFFILHNKLNEHSLFQKTMQSYDWPDNFLILTIAPDTMLCTMYGPSDYVSR